jgi:Kef-type K+ transport system membrane component KefB
MAFDVALLLMLLALGGALAPLVAPRLGLPEAVVQIAYGVALGATGLLHHGHGHGHGHGETEQVLHLLAELGFILLMFGAGMEIDFDAIERGGRAALLRGVGVALAVLGVSAVLSLAFGLGTFYVIVLSATSIGLGVVLLRETGHLTSPTGQAVLLVGSIGEFLTLVAMTVFDVSARVGVGMTLVWEVGELMLLVAAGVGVLRTLKAWTWWHPGVFTRAFQEHDPSEVGLRAAVAVCLAFVLLAVQFGIDPVLGSFIAGAIVRFVFRDVSVIEHKMSALSSGFFVPIFFISVGIGFDLGLLSVSGLTSALALGGLLLLARIIPALGLARGVDLGLREAMGAAFLLAAPLTLLVAIARLGADLGVVEEAEASAIVLLAVLMSVVAPLGFRALVPPPADEHAAGEH